eukprot:Lithocolla_globosa_v1_NODE_218_length_5069_cov_37.778620.p4 type:complete len:149 gc:universal NODE_218_length_5069_cov_37.778620:1786-2232(+)
MDRCNSRMRRWIRTQVLPKRGSPSSRTTERSSTSERISSYLGSRCGGRVERMLVAKEEVSEAHSAVMVGAGTVANRSASMASERDANWAGVAPSTKRRRDKGGRRGRGGDRGRREERRAVTGRCFDKEGVVTVATGGLSIIGSRSSLT